MHIIISSNSPTQPLQYFQNLATLIQSLWASVQSSIASLLFPLITSVTCTSKGPQQFLYDTYDISLNIINLRDLCTLAALPI